MNNEYLLSEVLRKLSITAGRVGWEYDSNSRSFKGNIGNFKVILSPSRKRNGGGGHDTLRRVYPDSCDNRTHVLKVSLDGRAVIEYCSEPHSDLESMSYFLDGLYYTLKANQIGESRRKKREKAAEHLQGEKIGAHLQKLDALLGDC